MRWVVLLAAVSAAGSRAQDTVSLVVLPLYVSHEGPLKGREADDATLERALRDALATESNVALAPPKEVSATMDALACSHREESSSQSLGRVAFTAGRLYALEVTVKVDDSGLLAAEGRVARHDGEEMVEGVARASWLDRKRPYDQVKELLLRLLGALQIDRLPVFKGTPVGECAFTAKLRDQARARYHALDRPPLSAKPSFRRALDALIRGLADEDCKRTIAALERLERAAAPPIPLRPEAEIEGPAGPVAPSGGRPAAGGETISNRYREYVHREQVTLRAILKAPGGSSSLVKKANEDIENGLAGGDCDRVRSGLFQLRHAAGIEE